MVRYPRLRVAAMAGDEMFDRDDTPLDFCVRDFWRWAVSDLADNVVRGWLAEFLVAWPLSVAEGVRGSWDAYDLKTKDGGQDSKRQADLYVFCVLKHQDKATLDPRNLDQWEFFVVPTTVLNRQRPQAKSLTMATLLELRPEVSNFSGLGAAVEKVAETLKRQGAS